MHASSQIVNYAFHSRLSALLRKAPTLTGAYNSGHTARYCSPKTLALLGTSHIRKTLYTQ